MNVEFSLKIIVVFTVFLLLLACTSIKTSQVVFDNEQRQKWGPLALQGDAEAQYQLAESYCCGSDFYSTDEAIRWWCEAALQGHQKASERLIERLGERFVPNYCARVIDAASASTY